ncbi:glycosyltransferase [Mucilaginibacter glaciei]|uniref:Glycosyltransferase family 4 protein n=1 Tax=Mucilaginibacter glaciei TaxID=2772109 RepID=A0A926NUA3_9SPHI|nr:glycosyltransferase [Mucilaginibacter glaciei]MBD1395403.1 glycosyltransferase family 4 protein [Mucilaginibacter glaciei]
MERKKILISAYALSPVKGSEFGAAWSTITNLATQHDLWVLYGISDDHMGDTLTLDKYIKQNPDPSINFIKVQGGRLANCINLLNKAGAGWFFYPAYYLWQKKALTAAREILSEVPIDVVHQLGPIGFREPGFLWQLDKPMVWGPIGGMITIDNRLLEGKPFITRLKATVKTGINYMQLNHSSRIRSAFEKAGVLVAATRTGQRIIEQKFNRKSYHMPETWLKEHAYNLADKFENISPEVQLVWSGSHIDRKNLQLCLHALAKVKAGNWCLNVLGSGPLTPAWKKLARELKLDTHIKWHGHLDRDSALNIMKGAHLHIITSIAEDNPNVVFEALSFGVPTLTIDHFGMADSVCNRCGVRITVAENKVMMVNMAAAITRLLADTEMLKKMAAAALVCALAHHREKRLAMLNTFYAEAIQIYNKQEVGAGYILT